MIEFKAPVHRFLNPTFKSAVPTCFYNVDADAGMY